MNYDCLKLENQLCFPIYLCSKEIIRQYTPYLEKLDLTYTQYITMLYLWEHGKSSVKNIGKALMLDSSTLTPLLKKLEIKEYVTRKRAFNDERTVEIDLTRKGVNLKNKAVLIPKEIGKCINLDKNEALTLYSLVYKVLKNIEKE